MSVEATTNVWKRSPHRGDILLVQLAIADVVNDVHDNEFFAYRDTLAKKARVSVRTLTNARKLLIEDGWLEVLEEGGGRGRSTRYRVHLYPETGQTLPGSEQQSGQSTTPNGATDARDPAPVLLHEPKEPATGEPGGSTRRRRRAPVPREQVRADADRIARDYWESQDPRPTMPFPAVRARVEECIRAGWPAPDVRAVLDEVESLTRWQIERALKQRRDARPDAEWWASDEARRWREGA